MNAIDQNFLDDGGGYSVNCPDSSCIKSVSHMKQVNPNADKPGSQESS